MSTHTLSTAQAGAAAEQLGKWFMGVRRELPWRVNRTPYRVWLSEVMLQQTQVAVVIDYFNRFTQRFPTVADLAAAPIDDVLALWSGLGYYARGRNLHKAAVAVAKEHQGQFPSTAAALLSLPGVGPYTAAAIASLAFGERIAAVDGNVLRVVARVLGSALPIDTPQGKAVVDEAAAALMAQAADPAVHNEAMMELGALVCTKKAPSCGQCPLSSTCVARATGNVLSLPIKAKKTKRKALDVACVVLSCGDEVALWRNDAHDGGGLFGGLYAPLCQQLGMREIADIDSAPTTSIVNDAWQALLAQAELPVPDAWPSPIVVERALTHRDLMFAVFHLRLTTRAPHLPWLPVETLTQVGISSAVAAVLSACGLRFAHRSTDDGGPQMLSLFARET